MELTEAYVGSYPRLRRLAARVVGVQDADDVVQEAFLRALRHGDRFRGDAAHATWLHRIVVNTGVDVRRYWQRRGVHLALDEIRVGLRGRAQSLPERHALRRALAALDARERDVCVLYDVMGYTHREIAGHLGIPLGTSKGRLCSARRRLRRLLTP